MVAPTGGFGYESDGTEDSPAVTDPPHFRVSCPWSGVQARMPIIAPKAHIQANWAAGVFYERALMSDAWKRFGTRDIRRIYDVGASVGNHLTWFALSWPGSTVYAFEPHAPSFDVLVEAVKLNGIGGRTLICPYGLGAVTRRGSMRQEGNEGMARFYPGLGDDVIVYPLDSVAFAPPDLIKIDVEGMEHDVIRGADRVLRVYRPPLYVEGNRDALADQLAPYGYRHVWTGNRTPTHGFVAGGN